MEAGWISGRIGRLRWLPVGASWMRFLGGVTLAANWVIPPLLEAKRCRSCGTGTFWSDPERR